MKRFSGRWLWKFFHPTLIALFVSIQVGYSQPEPIMHFSGSVTDVGFTPDSQIAIIARQSPGDDNLTSSPIFFWDIENKSVTTTFSGIIKNSVSGYDISDDGKLIAASYFYNDYAELIDINTKQLIQKFGPHPVIYNSRGDFLRAGVNKIKISSNKKWILTLGEDHNTYLWNTDSGNFVAVFHNINETLDFAFSPNLDFIFAGNSIWDFNTHELLHTLNPRNDIDINQLHSRLVCLSANNNYLYLAQYIRPIPVFGQPAFSGQSHEISLIKGSVYRAS